MVLMRRSRERVLAGLLGLVLAYRVLGDKIPIHMPTDGAKWFGNDGQWSTITLRLGNPVQYVYVLASTTTSETWVPGAVWCSETNSGYDCEERGNGFDFAASSTWREFGQFSIGYRPELVDDRVISAVKDLGYGEYGLDTLKFKTTGTDAREYKLDDQIIGAVNDTTILLGMMGLNYASRSFINETAYPSLMSTLYDNGTIPHMGFGYTAGAYHRPEKVPMDLVLGGSNLGRYSPNNMTFKLDANNNPLLTLNSLSVTATGIPPWGSGPETLSIEPIQVQVDSTTPYIWLPSDACRKFEAALGLTWDEHSNLYFVNETQVDSFNALNLTFIFSLTSSDTESRGNVDIAVPYGAFDLEIGFPFVNSSTPLKYFPLKQATDEKQYTLGRTFLTESYIAVDYKTGNFSLYQSRYPPAADKVVDTLHVETTAHPSSGLGAGAIAGIVVGVVAAIILALAGGLWFHRRKKAEKKEAELANPPPPPAAAWEVMGDEPKPPGYGESEGFSELPQEERTVERHELPSVNMDPAELHGIPIEEVPEYRG